MDNDDGKWVVIRKSTDKNDPWKCHRCGTINYANHKFCRYCCEKTGRRDDTFADSLIIGLEGGVNR